MRTKAKLPRAPLTEADIAKALACIKNRPELAGEAGMYLRFNGYDGPLGIEDPAVADYVEQATKLPK